AMPSSPTAEETARSCRANLENSLSMTDTLAACCKTPNDRQLQLMNNVLIQLRSTNFSEASRPSIMTLFGDLAVSPTMDSFSLGLMKFGCSFAVIVEEALNQLGRLRVELAAAAAAVPPPHMQQLHGNWNNNNYYGGSPSSSSSTGIGGSFSWAAHMEEETRGGGGGDWRSNSASRPSPAAAAARPTSSQPWSPHAAPVNAAGFGVLPDISSCSNSMVKQPSGGGGGGG
ncbi:hypothetical protein PENTCL1PPCAC_24108, partial [Pristionchus entomophagus]